VIRSTPQPPRILWVALLGLVAICFLQFLIALSSRRADLLFGIFCSLVLCVGLFYGHRWAFVLTLLFGVGTPIVCAFTQGLGPALGLAVINAVVYVPVLLARDYFWAARGPGESRG